MVASGQTRSCPGQREENFRLGYYLITAIVKHIFGYILLHFCTTEYGILRDNGKITYLLIAPLFTRVYDVLLIFRSNHLFPRKMLT